jgi:hypothetical protein
LVSGFWFVVEFQIKIRHWLCGGWASMKEWKEEEEEEDEDDDALREGKWGIKITNLQNLEWENWIWSSWEDWVSLWELDLKYWQLLEEKKCLKKCEKEKKRRKIKWSGE